MNIQKKIEENLAKYVTPYVDVTKEISDINANGFLSYDSDKKEIKLYDCQEEYLLNNRLNTITLVLKCRRSGITTAWLLHVLHELLEYKANADAGKKVDKPYFLYVTNTNNYAHETRKMFYFYLDSLTNSKDFYKLCQECVVFTYESGCPDKVCGRIVTEAMFDECVFFKNYEDNLMCLLSTMVKHITLASSIANDEQEAKMENIRKNLCYHFENKEGCYTYMEVHWWECPVFNKNLVWKKIEVEPVIDKDGNIAYNKERWEQKIKEGWIPTSEVFEQHAMLLGNKTKELLN